MEANKNYILCPEELRYLFNEVGHMCYRDEESGRDFRGHFFHLGMKKVECIHLMKMTNQYLKEDLILQVSVDIEQNWISCIVMDGDHECIYAPYYNTEFGKNKLLNKFNKNIKKILKQLENNKIITKMEDDENEDCEIW